MLNSVDLRILGEHKVLTNQAFGVCSHKPGIRFVLSQIRHSVCALTNQAFGLCSHKPGIRFVLTPKYQAFDGRARRAHHRAQEPGPPYTLPHTQIHTLSLSHTHTHTHTHRHTHTHTRARAHICECVCVCVHRCLHPRVIPTNYFTEMCSGSEKGSYSRFIDLCITQL